MKQSHDSLPIEWLDTVDSTNSEVRRRLDALDNMSVIASRFQTAGRGQGDHTWVSPDGENLTFSILFRFGKAPLASLAVADALRITQIATLSVHELLSSKGVESRIKWPNDIWVADRKICGMLIENILDGPYVACSIVGIGLNLNQQEFDPSLPNPVSLSMITGRKYSPDLILREFYNIISRRACLLGSPDGIYELESEFNDLVFRLEDGQRQLPGRQL